MEVIGCLHSRFQDFLGLGRFFGEKPPICTRLGLASTRLAGIRAGGLPGPGVRGWRSEGAQMRRSIWAAPVPHRSLDGADQKRHRRACARIRRPLCGGPCGRGIRSACGEIRRGRIRSLPRPASEGRSEGRPAGDQNAGNQKTKLRAPEHQKFGNQKTKLRAPEHQKTASRNPKFGHPNLKVRRAETPKFGEPKPQIRPHELYTSGRVA